jgi:hypothetical protein
MSTATADTLQVLAKFLAGAFRPFLSSMGSNESVTAFVAELGWSLPSVPPALTALGTSGDAMLDALTAVEAAIDDVDNGGDPSTLIEALVTLLAQIAVFASDIANLPAELQAQLPAAFVAATGIDKNFETRLVHDLAVREMDATMPLMTALLALVGLIEIASVAADPAHFQPDYTHRAIRFDRLGKFLNDPLSVLADVYGWGTPTLDLTMMFANIERLSYPLLGPIELRFPSDEMLGATAPGGVVSSDDGPSPAFAIPIYENGPFTLVLAVLPLPKVTPTELQGVALTLQLALAADTTIPLGPSASLALDGTLDLSSGVAAVLRPDKSPALVLDPNGAGAGVTGKGGAKLTFGDTTEATRLLTIPGGSYLEAQQLYVGAGVDATVTPADIYIQGGLIGGTFVLDVSQADSFLATILPSGGLTVHFDFGLAWSQHNGLRFSGGARLETTLAVNVSLGLFRVDSIYVLMTADGSALKLELSANGGGTLGPITASVSRIGATLTLAFQHGNLGPVDLSLGFKPPNGLGIAINAGPISGGGYIAFDSASGRYAGVLALQLYSVTITAIAILDTKLPGGQSGFSFLIILAVQFNPGFQLGFGFTLTAVGGLCGINRSMLTDAIQAGLRTHALDAILFPPNPVQNAPQIISTLSTIYPPAQGRYVFGPMLEIGWGTPTLMVAEIGFLIEVPSPIVLAILGQLAMVLPDPSAPIVEFHVDVLGFVDFGQQLFSIDATIHDSRIALFTVTGDMAFRLNWGDDPSFLFSIGGFNPLFRPPPNFPTLNRITVGLSADVVKLTFQAYLAVSSNTFQLGAKVEMYLGAGSLNVYGWMGFDALIIFSPFSFVVEFTAGLALRSGTSTIMGITVDGKLSGPTPWHAEGAAHVSILFFDVSVHVSVTIGDGQSNPLPTTNVWTPLAAAIALAANWSGALPAGAPQVATLAPPEGTAAPVLIDPAGTLTFRQKVVPLNQAITLFGEGTLQGQSEFDLGVVTLGGVGTPYTVVTEEFAPGQFQNLSDSDKLSAPSFEPMPAGFSVSDGAVTFGKQYDVDIEFETFIVDSVTARSRPGVRYGLTRVATLAMAKSGAAARGALFTTGIHASDPAPGTPPLVALTGAETYVIAGIDDLTVRADLTAPASKGAVMAALARHIAEAPEDEGILQVVPVHELAA